MRIRSTISALIITLLLSSCASMEHIYYFQDFQTEASEQPVAVLQEIRIRPEDKISILVNSKDPLLADLFNLPLVSRYVGQSSVAVGQNQGVSGYTVDTDGKIDFPVLGEISVAGKTREEIAACIKHELISGDLVKDPVVTVEFLNLAVSVMGEVNKPGRYNIDRDKITLLDALSMAGDLTIHGKRDNVMVLREEDGMQRGYRVNLGSARELYASPVYYLQQNDVVYVEPNSMRARQSTVNGNNVRSSSFWMSLASFLTTVIVLITK